MQNKSLIIPCLTYNDAKTAIEWLCNAFGFEKKMVVETPDGKILHSELTLNGMMIMVGSSDSGTEWGKCIKTPASIGGFETQSPYIVIEDLDTHYKKAIQHGAKVAIHLKEQDYGGKNYCCYDEEGHLWSFGSYNPWTEDNK